MSVTSRPRGGGFSLLEVLVGSAVSLLALGLAYQLLAHFGRMGSELNRMALLQQRGTVALARIALDARGSALASLVIARQTLALKPLSDLDASANQIWDTNPTLYMCRNSRLFRQRPEQSPAGLNPTQLELLRPGPGAVVLCEGLEELMCALSGPNPKSQLLQATLVLVDREGSRARRLEMLRQIYLRNAP